MIGSRVITCFFLQEVSGTELKYDSQLNLYYIYIILYSALYGFLIPTWIKIMCFTFKANVRFTLLKPDNQCDQCGIILKQKKTTKPANVE